MSFFFAEEKFYFDPEKGFKMTVGELTSGFLEIPNRLNILGFRQRISVKKNPNSAILQLFLINVKKVFFYK